MQVALKRQEEELDKAKLKAEETRKVYQDCKIAMRQAEQEGNDDEERPVLIKVSFSGPYAYTTSAICWYNVFVSFTQVV